MLWPLSVVLVQRTVGYPSTSWASCLISSSHVKRRIVTFFIIAPYRYCYFLTFLAERYVRARLLTSHFRLSAHELSCAQSADFFWSPLRAKTRNLGLL